MQSDFDFNFIFDFISPQCIYGYIDVLRVAVTWWACYQIHGSGSPDGRGLKYTGRGYLVGVFSNTRVAVAWWAWSHIHFVHGSRSPGGRGLIYTGRVHLVVKIGFPVMIDIGTIWKP